MKIISACLLLFMAVQSLHAQERLPIIDMHLHAMSADAQGPPPLAMCTPIQFPVWDQNRPYAETFMAIQKLPQCSDPVWSPETDDELMTQTIDAMRRLQDIIKWNKLMLNIRKHNKTNLLFGAFGVLCLMFFHFDDGKMVELWEVDNQLGFRRQLGLIP